MLVILMIEARRIVFDSLDTKQAKQAPDEPVTATEAFGVYILILALAFGSLAAFICLGDFAYGMQYATSLSYSGVIFVWTFFRTKGVKTKPSLSAPYVLDQLPRLLMIHLFYLSCIFFAETWAFAVRRTMSTWWLTSQGQRGMPPFDFVVMLTGMAIAISQIVVFRRILGRAKKQFFTDPVQK